MTPAATPARDARGVRDVALADALGERYLAYALSTITSRSLPDIRDGLKPVHRRLLYAMRQLRLDPEASFKKCARVVGDVMGKFHPHGDQAIYDAMVRLAQDFSVRYPIVEGQGNFGNIDGDNAAAMRYTEARLTEYALAMLDGIDEDAIDFQDNYDGTEREPVVLPASAPNLLANGAAGIAVGMATSIPPHNLGELCAGLLHLIKFPNATVAKLVELIPGPDFPTGGVLVEPRQAVENAYASGRGGFRLRARWTVEKRTHGQYRIVVHEIPYQTQKGRIVERIAELLAQRKLPLLADVRDESTDEVRLVLEPKNRSADPALVMEALFRHTDLETRVGLNMNVLEGGRLPRVANLRDVLGAWLRHRHEVLQRRTRHRLDKIDRRLELLGGYLIVYANLDEVIRIIREADDPKAEMVARWRLSDPQAEAILGMQLRSLRRLREVEIRREFESLTEERDDKRALLADEKRRWRAITDQIRDLARRFGGKTPLGRRRTEIGAPPVAVVVPPEAMIEREPISVVCSQKGWIRAVRGHVADGAELKYKEGDGGRFLIHAETTDKLIVFGANGRFYTLGCDRLPGGRGHGEPLRLMIDLGNDREIVAMLVHRPGRRLLVAARSGRGFVVPEDAVLAQTRAGKQVLVVADDDEARVCAPATGDAMAAVGDNRKLLAFPLSDLPEMSRGRGVRLQRYREGGLSDTAVFTLARGLTWRVGGRTRTEADARAWLGRRGQSGKAAPRGFPKSNRFA